MCLRKTSKQNASPMFPVLRSAIHVSLIFYFTAYFSGMSLIAAIKKSAHKKKIQALRDEAKYESGFWYPGTRPFLKQIMFLFRLEQ